nr:aminotransferase class IV family protein [uncultured Prevotella sp.]
MYRFIETLRIEDKKVFNLEAHNQRLNKTIRHFSPRSQEIDLGEHITADLVQRTKCHIVYSDQVLSVSYQPYHPRPVHSLQLIECDAIDYAYKYEDRDLLLSLYGQRGQCDDILIVKNGVITDTSIANIAVYDGTQWYTPAHPLLRGTQRELLLRQGLLTEREITPAELFSYRKLCTLNAMLDFEEMEFEISDQTIKRL